MEAWNYTGYRMDMGLEFVLLMMIGPLVAMVGTIVIFDVKEWLNHRW